MSTYHQRYTENVKNSFINLDNNGKFTKYSQPQTAEGTGKTRSLRYNSNLMRSSFGAAFTLLSLLLSGQLSSSDGAAGWQEVAEVCGPDRACGLATRAPGPAS